MRVEEGTAMSVGSVFLVLVLVSSVGAQLQLPCDSPLRQIYPELFPHCSPIAECVVTQWSEWTEFVVSVDRSICDSGKQIHSYRQRYRIGCEPPVEVEKNPPKCMDCSYSEWSEWEVVPESIITVNGSMCPSEKAINHSRSRQLLSADSDKRCDPHQAEIECICLPTRVQRMILALGLGSYPKFSGTPPPSPDQIALPTFIAGAPGPPGEPGPPGPPGPKGVHGPKGLKGSMGPNGHYGSPGQKGLTGTHGHYGPPGTLGDPGLKGSKGTKGPPGPSGLRGVPGPPSNIKGSRGPTGYKGNYGVRGFSGPKGYKGYRGSQGPRGSRGPPGAIGPRGPSGPPARNVKYFCRRRKSIQSAEAYCIPGLPGPPGNHGPPGPRGPIGDLGDWGDGGSNGSQGSPGQPGSPGSRGPTGYPGAHGPPGSPGSHGDFGSPGAPGSPGAKGFRGLRGPEGDKGVKGASGSRGSTGPPGLPGDKGSSGPPGLPGDKGYKGIKGHKGMKGHRGQPPSPVPVPIIPYQPPPEGIDPTFREERRSISSCPPGRRGPPGPPGPAGLQGFSGSPGPLGPEGHAGVPGLPGAPGINGPPGHPGAPGPKAPPGVQGSSGPPGIPGNLGPPGSPGDIGFKGSQGPRGDRGDQGPRGATASRGNRGPPGVVGNSGSRGPKGDRGRIGDPGNPGVLECHYYYKRDIDYNFETEALSVLARGNMCIFNDSAVCSSHEVQHGVRNTEPHRRKRSFQSTNTPVLLDEAPTPFSWKKHHMRFRRSHQERDCDSERYVLFLMDTSDSIGEENYQKMKEAVSNLTLHFCGNVKFALLTFSEYFHVEFCFDCFDCPTCCPDTAASTCEPPDLQKPLASLAIKHSNYRSYYTHTAGAINCTVEEILTEQCGLPASASCIDVIIITDGASNDPDERKVCNEVQDLHDYINSEGNKVVNTYAIGIGNSVDSEELECIAHHSNLNGFSFESFTQFEQEMHHIREIIYCALEHEVELCALNNREEYFSTKWPECF